MQRRSLLLAPALLATPALAQGTRPVRVIIPFSPGGASDLMMRPVADRLERLLGQPFVIDNRAGGGGAVGLGAAAGAPPDGQTLLLTTPGPLVLLPQMQAGLSYTPRSFTPIALMGGAPILCAVAGNSPIRDLPAYAAAAKAAPEAVSFGSSGIGSMGHLTGVLFGMEAGARLLHAPFRGAPEAQTAVLGGSTTSLWDTAAANVAAVRAGNLRGLCVSSAERVAMLPDVPTAREAGFGNVVSLNWFLLCAPAGLPEPVAARLAEAVAAAMADAGVQERHAQAAFVPAGNVPRAGLPAWVEAEQARWAPVIRASGAVTG